MSRAAERAQQASFIENIGLVAEPSQGPVALPPAPVRVSAARGKGPRTRTRDAAAEGPQLRLPLYPEIERRSPEADGGEPGPASAGAEPGETPPGAEPRPLSAAGRGRGRRGRRGFVPVTHDPDVARSYSDNAALGNAVGQGLAQMLAGLSAEERAALRARVARAAQHEGEDATPLRDPQ